MPLVLEGIGRDRPGRSNLVRIIRETEDYSNDANIMRRIADNRMRLDALTRQIEEDFPEDFEPDDFTTELDYINASIQLGILQLTGELEETQTSDEIFDSEVEPFAETALA